MIDTELADIARHLRALGDHDIADKVLCAFSAVTDKEDSIVDLSYTSVMRDLRKNHKENVSTFQKVFKDVFEEALDNNIKNPDKIALMEALKQIDYKE